MTVHLSDLRELVVDGVQVFHLPGPSKTSATLYFGVGQRDETFDSLGVTHLVEHLAMAQLPKSHLDSGASVSLDHTTFTARGRPAEVGAFLRHVCEALADLPVAQLDREKGVVLTELSGKDDSTAQAAWAVRYGFAGVGLVTSSWRSTPVVSDEDVLAHAAAHFHAGRAALAVLGPLPEGLSLPLPPAPPPAAGAAPPRTFPAPVLGDGPQWVQAPTAGIALLLDGLAPDDAAVRVASSVLGERLLARGNEHHLAFGVVTDLIDGPDGDVLTVTLDLLDADVDATALLVWEQLLELAAHGPTQAELDHALESYAAELDPTDDAVVEHEPAFRAACASAEAATGRHHGRPPQETAAAFARATRDDVRDRLASAARRALLVLPLDGELPAQAQEAAQITWRPWCEELPELPPGRRLRPRCTGGCSAPSCGAPSCSPTRG